MKSTEKVIYHSLNTLITTSVIVVRDFQIVVFFIGLAQHDQNCNLNNSVFSFHPHNVSHNLISITNLFSTVSNCTLVGETLHTHKDVAF